MILLDTGYLVALHRTQDELHTRAAKWAMHLQEPLLLTEFVAVESLNAMSQPDRRQSANHMIQQMMRDPAVTYVPSSDVLLSAGLDLHLRRPDKHWSLTNCISFLIMQERKIRRALSHDQHFEQAGFEALLRKDPDEAASS